MTGPESLLTVTATELAVLEAAHLRQLVALGGGHEGCPADEGGEGDDVRREAVRSLTARGMLTVEGALHEESVAGQVVELLLDLRVAASSLVLAERLLGLPVQQEQELSQDPDGGRRDLRMLHLTDLGGVVEDVHPDGIHSLELLLEPEDLVRAVTDFLVPPDAAPGAGEVRHADPANPEQLPGLLGKPTVLGQLTSVEAGPDHTPGRTPPSSAPEPTGAVHPSSLVALGPGGCFAAELAPARSLAFAPVDPGWVAATVGGWVRSTVLPVREADTAQ